MKINKEQFLEKYKKHQEWLVDNTKGKRLVWNFEINFKLEFDFELNLRSANLRSADLSSADLSSANLRSADLSSADLSYANLRYADLSSANLRSADLSSADLSYANLRYADLSSADLSYADLRSADLRYANLRSADLDFSSWELSCKTKEVKLCKKLQAQLLGHVMNVSPDVNYSKEQVQFVKDNWPRFEEFCNDKIKGLL